MSVDLMVHFGKSTETQKMLESGVWANACQGMYVPLHRHITPIGSIGSHGLPEQNKYALSAAVYVSKVYDQLPV